MSPLLFNLYMKDNLGNEDRFDVIMNAEVGCVHLNCNGKKIHVTT